MCKLCHRLFTRGHKNIRYNEFQRHFKYNHNDVIKAYKNLKGKDKRERWCNYIVALRRRTRLQVIIETYEHNLKMIEELKSKNEEMEKQYGFKKMGRWVKKATDAFDKEVEKSKESLIIK